MQWWWSSDSGKCLFCDSQDIGNGEQQHESACSVRTNYWVAFDDFWCDLCTQQVEVGDQYRLIPQPPPDVVPFNQEKIGRVEQPDGTMQVCIACCTLRVAYTAPEGFEDIQTPEWG